MKGFIWNFSTELIVGEENSRYFREKIRQCGKNILVVCGRNTTRLKKIEEICDGANFVVLSGVNPEADIKWIEKGVEIIRKRGDIECIIGVGGGSVLDIAKGISVACERKGSVQEALETGTFIRTKPLIAIPTLIGSGSECSRGMVIQYEGKKHNFSADALRPDYTYVNESFFETIPKDKLILGCVDAISHILERYYGTDTNVFSDDLAFSTINSIIRNLYLLLKGASEKERYRELEYATMIANSGMISAGGNNDGLCHAIEHTIGVVIGCSHTEGILILELQRLLFYSKKKPARVYKLLSHTGLYELFNIDNTIDAFVDCLKKNIKKYGIKTEFDSIQNDKAGIRLALEQLYNEKKMWHRDISMEEVNSFVQACFQGGKN